MLTRSIDLDPFALTIEEKVFRIGKRVCIVFAAAALSISALDLLNMRPLENTAEFLHGNRPRIADLPAHILTGIREISVLPSSPSVTIAIPRDAVIDRPKIALAPPARAPQIAAKPPVAPTPRIAAASPPPPVQAASIAVKSNPSPVAELAAARHLDAIEFAMASPTVTEKSQQVSLSIAAPAMPAAPVVASASEPMKLASVDPGALPAAIAPESGPVSLSMASLIPLDMVPMPRAAPGLPPPSPAERLHLEGKERAKAERCLANAIYFEARSEPVRGQMAVAQVVLNRVFSGFYPNDVCSVVYQNASRHLACQFTFACDGKRKVINERGNWARANRIAKQTLDGQIYVPEVAKSTHYHAVYVHPNWVREMKKMVRYGVHNFYRPIAWGNGAEEPVWGSPALLAQMKKK